MPHFSDDYFRDLPPRDRRYDTPVADQLVFSVFPNGVKSWVHVYPCDDFVRRRTMGLFPEMDYAMALSALEQSRRIAEVDALQTRGWQRSFASYWRFAGVAMLAAALAAAVTYGLTRSDPPGEIPAAARPVPAEAPDRRDDGQSAPRYEETTAGTAESAMPDTPAGTKGPAPDPSRVPGSQTGGGFPPDAETSAQETPAPVSPTETAEAPLPSPADSQDAETRDSSDGPVQEEPPVDLGSETGALPGKGSDSAGVPADPVPAPADLSPAVPIPSDQPPRTAASIQTESEGTAADDSGPPPGGTGAPLITVSRAALATAIRDREPVDQLAGVFRRPEEDPFRLYFFTELTGRPGDVVLHRWQKDGVTVAERSFRVGEGARWRIFSSKYIPPSGGGEWRATLVDTDGHAVESRTLQVETGP